MVKCTLRVHGDRMGMGKIYFAVSLCRLYVVRSLQLSVMTPKLINHFCVFFSTNDDAYLENGSR